LTRAVSGFRFYADAPGDGATHGFNGHTTQATYDGAGHKQTAYAQPALTAGRTPETVPTTEPATANLGIAGSLTGSLTGAGWSDYLVSQIRLTAGAAAGKDMTLTYQYDETA
jgi:hypothetical protein